MSDFVVPDFLLDEEDEGEEAFSIPDFEGEMPPEEFEVPDFGGDELGTFVPPAFEGGEEEFTQLDLADPRFAELRDVQRQLAEMQARLDSGEVPIGEEFQNTPERTELHNRLWELSDELKAEYNLTDFELRNLVIPSEFPWLQRADADPITEMARDAYARQAALEGRVRESIEGLEGDEELTRELISVASEFEAYTEALADKYGISEEEAQRLARIPANLEPEQRLTAFIDPSGPYGLEGLARGFLEGLTVGQEHWIPSNRLSVWGGRLVGSTTDSFVGTLEFIMFPWQMNINTLSNFAYLQEHNDPGERAERLMEQFNVSGPLGRGVFTTWSTAMNLSHAFQLNNSYLYSVIPQLLGIHHPLIDELPPELRDRGTMFAVNLETGRANDWATYWPDFRSNFADISIGTRAGELTRGTEVLDQVGVFDRLGVDNPVAQEVMGLVLDLSVDPATWIDGLFMFAKLLHLGGARGAARQLGETAERVKRGLNPRGLVDPAWRNLDDPMHPQYYTAGRTAAQTEVMTTHGARSVPERAMVSAGKVFDDLMNIEIPVGDPITRGALGITDQAIDRVPMRYWIYTEGVLDLPIPYFRQGLTNIPQELTGGPAVGPGMRERSIGVARAFARTAMEGSINVKEILQAPVAQYQAISLRNLKINFPGLGVRLDRRGEGYVRTMNELVWDFVDNIGITDGQRVIRDGISPASLPRNEAGRVLVSDIGVQVNPMVPFDPETADWFEMARNIARAFEVPEDVAITSFRAAVREASNISAQLGYQLSDYETYVSMMARAADNLTERTGRAFDPNFMRAQIEADLAGLDVDLFVREGEVRPLSFVDDVSRASRATPPPGAPPEPPPFVVDMAGDRILVDETFVQRAVRQLDQFASPPRGSAEQPLVDRARYYLDYIERMPDGPDKDAAQQLFSGLLGDYTDLMDHFGAGGWRRLEDGPRVTWEKIPGMTPPAGAVDGPEWFRYDMGDYEMFRREVMSLFSTEGNPFAHLSPENYLRGLREGYLRRTFGAKLDPDTVMMRVRMRDIALFPSSISHEGVVDRVRFTFGDEAAEAVGTYFAGRSENQIVFTEEVFDVISRVIGTDLPVDMNVPAIVARVRQDYGSQEAVAMRAYLSGTKAEDLERLGVPVDRLEAIISEIGMSPVGDGGASIVGRWNLVNDVIYGDDFDYNFLKKTVALIDDQNRNAARVGGVSGFDPTMTPGAFQAREALSLDQRTMLLQIKDATSSLASLAARGGRALRSQTMLRDVYDFFRQNNLLYSLDDLQNLEVRTRFSDRAIKTIFGDLGQESWRQIADVDGRRWVRIPNNAGQWGVLAGSVVPNDVGRWLMMMSQSPADRMPSMVRNGLNLYRRLQLAPYPTVMRNIYGQFVIAQQHGISLVDMIKNLPRAWKARNEYLRTGSSPIMRGGEKGVGFFEDVHLSAQVRQQLESMLESLARPDVLKRLRNITTTQGRIEEIGRVIGQGLDDIARAPLPRVGAGVQLEGSTPITRGIAAAGNWLSGATARSALNPMGRVPSFGGLDLFTASEEITRAAIYLSVMDKAIGNGVPVEHAVRMAAHAGNHAVNNYANVPLIVEGLRNTGLGLFPAFTYLQIGRVARAAWQNQQALAKQQHLIRGASNILSAGISDEEREALYENMSPYLRDLPGLWVSAEMFGGEGGHYWRVPVEKIFPIGLQEFMNYGEEAARGGVWNPILDGLLALTVTDGLAPFASEYGRGRVFEPTDSPMEKLTKSLIWLAESFQPGQLREIQRGVETVESQTGPFFDPQREKVRDYREQFALDSGRHPNRNVEQFLVRQLGFNLYVVDIARDGPSETTAMRSIEAQANMFLQSIRRQEAALEALWFPGHPKHTEGMVIIEGDFNAALRRYAQDMNMSWERATELFGHIYEEFR